MNYPIQGKGLVALGILAALAAVQPSSAQIQCGGEYQPVCGSSDAPYSVWYAQSAPNPSELFLPVFTGVGCDLALGAKGGICDGHVGGVKGGVRHNQQLESYLGQPSNQWINFAMRQQNAIQSDQVINWTTVFGTHNSFSNFQDGSFSAINADQYFSISDQLAAGARYLRIDPVTYSVPTETGSNSGLRVCHESSTPGAECNVTSYGRLFQYSLAEVRTWLKNNPFEVLVLRLDNVQSSDWPGIDQAIGQELEFSGIPVLLPSTTGVSSPPSPVWNPQASGWPTLRQMRTLGARIIIFSDSGTPDFAFSWNSYVLSDGYSDVAGFNPTECQNGAGTDVRTRSYDQWAYIGEDRSLSVQVGSCSPQCGLLTPTSVATATSCGFTMVNVDFLLAGFATRGQGAFTDPDLRREASIWSWDQGDLGNNGTAYMKSNGRWSSMPPSTAMPFACAVGESSSSKPAHYTWLITSVSDQWGAGPGRCAQIPASSGGPGVFWAPQSALENAALQTAAAGQNVWINYGAGGLFLEPGPPLSTSATGPGVFAVHVVHAGNAAALKNLYYQFTGGFGGLLTVTPQPGTPPLFSSYTVSSLKKVIKPTLAPGVLDANGNVALAAGAYTENFTVQETLPNGQYSVTSYSITLNVASNIVNVNLGVTPIPATVIVDNQTYKAPLKFNWVIGSSHVVTFPTPQALSQQGAQLVFANWSDNVTGNTRTIVVPSSNAAFIGVFNEQYLVTTASSPSNGGTVTGGGWYTENTNATLTATAGGGYAFNGFNGNSSLTSPWTIRVGGPMTVTADFTSAQPQLAAIAQVESSSASQVELALTVNNVGPGTAAGAVIDSVNFSVQFPSIGTVTLAQPLPIQLGTLAGGASLPNVQLLLNWPSTALQVQMNIHFTANQGAWQGAQTLTLSR